MSAFPDDDEFVVVEVETDGPTSVEVVEPELEPVEVALEVTTTNVVETLLGLTGPPGPPGEKGEPGDAGGQHTHVQELPEQTWVIDHPLGGYPAVTVVDSAGSVVEGNVEYPAAGQVRVTFSGPFSGRAHLS